MDFELSDRCHEFSERLDAFMHEHVYPAEAVFEEQLLEAGDPHADPPVMEELKAEARRRGLWNLFHPDPEYGPGLRYVEYAPLAEIMGRSALAPEACNCNAPDTGNMEVLTQFGSDEQQERWLRPLLDGRDPLGVRDDRAGRRQLGRDKRPDAHRARRRRLRPQRPQVVDDRGDPRALPDLHRHGQDESRRPAAPAAVDDPRPARHAGRDGARNLTVFGYSHNEGHGDVLFEDVRVPVANRIAGEGDGFLISQARLGPGRIHHCMRTIGAAERALELMCRRASERVTFGAAGGVTRRTCRTGSPKSRIEIDMARLLTLKAAWLIDTVGSKHARTEIAAIKVAAPEVALKVIDRAIQVHGGGGVSQDFPLAWLYAHVRTLRLADGPDEVHKMTIARRELRAHQPRRRPDAAAAGLCIPQHRPRKRRRGARRRA